MLGEEDEDIFTTDHIKWEAVRESTLKALDKLRAVWEAYNESFKTDQQLKLQFLKPFAFLARFCANVETISDTMTHDGPVH